MQLLPSVLERIEMTRHFQLLRFEAESVANVLCTRNVDPDRNLVKPRDWPDNLYDVRRYFLWRSLTRCSKSLSYDYLKSYHSVRPGPPEAGLGHVGGFKRQHPRFYSIYLAPIFNSRHTLNPLQSEKNVSHLKKVLLETDNRKSVIADCVHLVETEVSKKSGLGGMAVKTAFGVIKKLNPQIIHLAVGKLIDDFVEAMEPFFVDFQNSEGTNLERHWVAKSPQLANALLGVTDTRIARAQNKTIAKAYKKLRPAGTKHVEASIPGIAQVVARYV